MAFIWFICKELSRTLSMGVGKSKKKTQHSHGDGDDEQERVFYDAGAHGVAGCPGCAALTRRNTELEVELASLRKVIQRPPDSVTCFR